MTRVAVDRELLTEVLDYLEVASETAKHEDEDPCHELLRRLMLDSSKSLTRWGWTWQGPYAQGMDGWQGTPTAAAIEQAKTTLHTSLSLYFFQE